MTEKRKILSRKREKEAIRVTEDKTREPEGSIGSQVSSMNSSENQTNCSSVFEDHEFTNVAVVNMVVGLLSFIICCFTIILIAVLKRWQFFSQRLILYLTITAMLLSLSNIINRVDFAKNPTTALTRFCIFGGFFSQVTSWMTLCSNTSITIYLFLRTMFKKNTEKYELLYVMFTFGFPFLFSWIPFINTSYGRAGVWCWIRSYDMINCKAFAFGKWLQFGLLYIPLYVLLAVLIVLYILIIAKIYRQRKVLSGTDNPHASKVVRKIMSEVLSLIAYPLIYFVLTLPLLLNRIHASINPEEPSLTLWYLAALTFPLEGACTGFVFTFNTLVCRRTTWIELRSQTGRTLSRKESQHKITEYPMKTDEVSDSAAFSTAHRPYYTIDYTEYTVPQ